MAKGPPPEHYQANPIPHPARTAHRHRAPDSSTPHGRAVALLHAAIAAMRADGLTDQAIAGLCMGAFSEVAGTYANLDAQREIASELLTIMERA